jgi:hypothetical protein
MGSTIAQGLSVDQKSPHLVAVIVVTHSRPLLNQLTKLDPHVLIFAEDTPSSLQEYLDRPVVIRPLQELKDLSHQRFQRIQKVLNMRKKNRK